jgi:hypothetical protein
MQKTERSPRLTIVDPPLSPPRPSRPLGEHGEQLWRQTIREYRIEDVAGVEMLTQACQALDRAEGLAARIAEDGEIVRGASGIKVHPAIREELAARSFVVRTLQKLGLNFEPLRAGPGRPVGS